MAKLRILLQPPLDSLANLSSKGESVEVDTIYRVLEEICFAHQSLQAQLFIENGLSPFIHIFLNGKLIDHDNCKFQLIADNDELCLLTAIRGGSE